MNAKELLENVLCNIRLFKDDKEKLQKLYDFILEELAEPEFEEVETEIPEKFKSIVPKIAEDLDCGMECYVNLETAEYIPLLNESDGYIDEEDKINAESIEKIDFVWKKKCAIHPPDSTYSYNIMERFVNEKVNNQYLRKELTQAIKGRKPFANFKIIIDDSEELNNWFAFKQKCFEDYVKEEIAQSLSDM